MLSFAARYAGVLPWPWRPQVLRGFLGSFHTFTGSGSGTSRQLAYCRCGQQSNVCSLYPRHHKDTGTREGTPAPLEPTGSKCWQVMEQPRSPHAPSVSDPFCAVHRSGSRSPDHTATGSGSLCNHHLYGLLRLSFYPPRSTMPFFRSSFSKQCNSFFVTHWA